MNLHDLALLAGWLVVLGGGLGVCVALKSAGMAVTHVRDLLHVGAGVWVVGWPWWHSPLLPTALTVLVFLATLAAPRLGGERLRSALSGGEERWSGIVLYTLSFGALTGAGLARWPFPAAAGLLALALGDGLGGALGVRFGRHRFRIGGAKPKSIEGCLGVWLFSALGIVLAAWLFHAQVPLWVVTATALLAALAEAVAPRASDNVLVPAVVFGALVAL